MERRLFLKQTSLASLAILLSPAWAAACKKKNPFGETDFSGKIIIVGAGAAGLYAGYVLQSMGVDFTILEAADRLGGRMGKSDNFADFPIDLGAQWLHGKNSITGDLVRKTKTKITLDDSEAVYWVNHELTTSLPDNFENFEEAGGDLPDISFAEYAQQLGFGEEYKYLVEQMAGDLGADSSEISVKWAAAESENWTSGNRDYKFEKTFFDLLNENIAESIKSAIQLNTPISQIDHSGPKVKLTDINGEEHLADKVIITVPITVLQQDYITFKPALPAEKTAAFNKIGMGAGMKVFLKFNTRFYPENIGGGKICAAYADDSVGKKGHDNVLLAFIMGKQAEYLTSLVTDEAIVGALLDELDEMFDGQASSTFIDAHVQNWTTNPYVMGAYSFSKIGIGNARSIAAQPVGNLFFAGEAMNTNSHFATVHGAMETGYNAVLNLIQSDKK